MHGLGGEAIKTNLAGLATLARFGLHHDEALFDRRLP
jgi:hypothetical protein